MNDGTFRFADDLGPEKIITIHDPAVGLKAVLVVDNVAVGPSIGGTRMAADASVEECFRLARAMTLKNAAAGLRHGGGKSVIVADPRQPRKRKEELVRAFAHAVRDVKDYIPGPDMGTDETCMAWVRDVAGRAVGLPREVGGIPLDEIGATGLGLAAAVDVAKDFVGIDLDGARVVVQGFGSVGRHAARFLAEKGARVVGASDSEGAVINPKGLDLERLLRHKAKGRSVAAFDGGRRAKQDELIGLDCEIWIPAARPDVITAANAGRIKARIVAQGANIPATPEAEAILHERGVLVLPDFIANAGGVICAAVEYAGGTESQAMATIVEKVATNTRAVLTAAKRRKQQPRAAAMALARARVQAAMGYRRTF